MAKLSAFRERYGLPVRYVVYPANFWPHKNHLRLLQAWQQLRDEVALADYKLALCGAKERGHNAILTWLAQLSLADTVVLLGYLPAADMPLLYAAASLMVFPSLFEGFGLPILEAMAAGCPVACSNTTSLPEIAGDAAIYFNPLDPSAIAQSIFALLSNEDLRRAFIARGLSRASKFSWEECAKQTLAVYLEVATNAQRH